MMNSVVLLRRHQNHRHVVAATASALSSSSCGTYMTSKSSKSIRLEKVTSTTATIARALRCLPANSYYYGDHCYTATSTGIAHMLNGTVGRSRYLSTTAREDSESNKCDSVFAVVDHGKAYEESMEGRHGKQLALAELEGVGKDDPPYDPFSDAEDDDDDDDDDEERNKVIEVDAVEKKSAKGDEDNNDDFEDEDDEDYRDDDDDEIESIYNNDGSLRWKKSDRAIFRAGAPSGGVFAIIKLANYQYKVTTDDVIIVNKLNPVSKYKIGSLHTLKNEDVLLLGTSHMTLVGMPGIQNAEVDIMIEEITQDKKIVVFKKRRRKHSQRKKGFRRDITLIRIVDIRLPEQYQNHYHIKRKNPVNEE